MTIRADFVKRIEYIVFVLIVVVPMIGFWSAYLMNRRLRQESKALIVAAHATPLVNGSKIGFTNHLELNTKQEDLGWKLVLVSSDTCPACLQVLPQWLVLIQSVRLGDRDEIIFISRRGTFVPSQLALAASQRGLAHRIINSPAVADFWMDTGIASTPMVILVDEESRLRWISNTLETSERDALLTYFERHLNLALSSLQHGLLKEEE